MGVVEHFSSNCNKIASDRRLTYMVSIDQEIAINAQITKVFAYIAKPNNIPNWRPDVKKVFDINGDGSKGTTYKEAVKGFGIFEMKVLDYQLNKKIIVQAVSGPAVRPTQTFSFNGSGASTILKIHVDATVDGVFKLMRPVLPKMINKNWQKYLKTVKNSLEK